MTHLRIENQNSNVEIVNAAIILKLYNLALGIEENLEEGESLSDYVSLKGNLLADHGRQRALTYLNNKTKFPNLLVNVPVGAEYIDFADPEVERVLKVNNVGDGVGITLFDLSNIGTWFLGNTNIVSFNELRYTNVHTIGDNAFRGCTSLTSIDLSNVTSIGSNAFNGCASLSNVTWPSNNFTIDSAAFRNSGLTGDIDLSNCTTANVFETYRNVFAGSKITSIYNTTNATVLGDYDNGNVGQFQGCSNLITIDLSLSLITNADGSNMCIGCINLKYVKFPSTLTKIGGIFAYTNYLNTIKVSIPCTTPPTFKNSEKLNRTSNNPNYTCNFEIYVPDASVSLYQDPDCDWSSYTIKPISKWSES